MNLLKTSLDAKKPLGMLCVVRLLAGLAAFGTTKASPVSFVDPSSTGPSHLLNQTRSSLVIPKPQHEAPIVEGAAAVSTGTGAGAGAGSTAPGWSYVSCFTDDISSRALSTQVHIRDGPDAMSVSQCNYKCWVEGYKLSGVEFARECWCDHALNNNGGYHVKVRESECDMACTGDKRETCGGANRIAIYKYSTTPALETGRPILESPSLETGRPIPAASALVARSPDIVSLYIAIGCYRDSTTGRILRHYISSPGAEQDMTVGKCVTECYNSGFAFAGLEYGHECFCDTLLQTIVKASQGDCNMACPGSSGEICGGDLRTNVYSYHGATPLKAAPTTASTATTASALVVPSNPPITEPGSYQPKGCYSDVTYNRTLGFVGSFPGSRDAMTIGPCQSACKHAGFVFAGVEFGHECWCDNHIRGFGVPVPDSDCNLVCSGNKSETCGGINRVSLFSFAPATTTSTTPKTASAVAVSPTDLPPQPNSYFLSIGCYTDARSSRTLGVVGDFPGAHGSMNIEACLGACRNAHYYFAGVEFGNECWCDTVIRGVGSPTSRSDCDMPCSGNSSEICGGSNRINIFQLTLAPTVDATPFGASATACIAPVSATSSPSPAAVCVQYYQVAQGDRCYGIWTGFRISQEQFASWNPSLVFPQCHILTGQSICVQRGAAGSPVLTITALPPAPTPTDVMAPTTASLLLLSTATTSSASMAEAPTSTMSSTASALATVLFAPTVPCSVFYQVGQGDYCYDIWTAFGISPAQFTLWNPSLVFPACQIFPGDSLCIHGGGGSGGGGSGPATTVTDFPAASGPASGSGAIPTLTVSTTRTSTVMVTTQTLSSSGGGDFSHVTPIASDDVPTSTGTLPAYPRDNLARAWLTARVLAP